MNVTCFIDCCHSGTITRLAIGTPPGLGAADAGTMRSAFPAGDCGNGGSARGVSCLAATGKCGQPWRLRRRARRVLFCACRSAQSALEQCHGHFTTKATQILRAGIQGLTNEGCCAESCRLSAPHPQNPGCCSPTLRGSFSDLDNAGGRSVSIDAPLARWDIGSALFRGAGRRAAEGGRERQE